MMNLKLSLPADTASTILCLGCHSDDIEIGCGGTVLRLLEEYPHASIYWVVFSAIGPRKDEAAHAASRFVPTDRMVRLSLHEFRDGFMPYDGDRIKAIFEEIKREIVPDLIFTHSRRDAHQDHRLVAETSWNTFRNHMILEYEIPKYDGDLGQPSVFFPLPQHIYEAKVRFLMECFATQRSKAWFDEATFLALMRLRGMECNAPSGYAEAFYSRKLVL